MTEPASDSVAPTLAIDDHGGWSTILSKLIDGGDLSRLEAEAAMSDVLAGVATHAQIAGLLVGLKAKGEETVEELTGFATAMLAAAEPLSVDERAIDIVGTGGSDPRRESALNVSTMANPARVTRQLVGVASPERAAVMAEVLVALGLESAWVVAGADGLDELSTTGDSVVYKVRNGTVERQDIALAALGIEQVGLADLAGGSAEDNLAIFKRILAGDAGPHRDIVTLNAGAALVVAGLADDLADGINQAGSAIDDGRTEAKLEQLREVSNRLK